jgi:hypothetical protein
MRTRSFVVALLLLLSAVVSIKAAQDSSAKPGSVPTLQLEFVRSSLQNVDDQAGRWQFEGGKVMQKGEHIANYASTKRVVNQGTDEQNTAMLTITIFFLGKSPPQNMTLQGAHNFNSGDQIGSVSAASPPYLSYIGKPFASKQDKVTIN